MKHILIFLANLAAGFVCGAASAAILIPLALSERGYFAIGGEWFLILLISFGGYSAFNAYLFTPTQNEGRR